jgi:hypothetical protein
VTSRMFAGRKDEACRSGSRATNVFVVDEAQRMQGFVDASEFGTTHP